MTGDEFKAWFQDWAPIIAYICHAIFALAAAALALLDFVRMS